MTGTTATPPPTNDPDLSAWVTTQANGDLDTAIQLLDLLTDTTKDSPKN
jgi:hypothetical protein